MADAKDTCRSTDFDSVRSMDLELGMSLGLGIDIGGTKIHLVASRARRRWGDNDGNDDGDDGTDIVTSRPSMSFATTWLLPRGDGERQRVKRFSNGSVFSLKLNNEAPVDVESGGASPDIDGNNEKDDRPHRSDNDSTSSAEAHSQRSLQQRHIRSNSVAPFNDADSKYGRAEKTERAPPPIVYTSIRKPSRAKTVKKPPKVICSIRLPTGASFTPEMFDDILVSFLEDLPNKSIIRSVGIAICGLVDPETSEVKICELENLTGWNPLRAVTRCISRVFSPGQSTNAQRKDEAGKDKGSGSRDAKDNDDDDEEDKQGPGQLDVDDSEYSVVVVNDAHAALMYAAQYEQCQVGARSSAVIIAGTGIGCAMMIDNNIIQGGAGLAGNLGIAPVDASGRTVDDVASGRKLAECLKASVGWDPKTAISHLRQAVTSEDEIKGPHLEKVTEAQEIIEQFGSSLGVAVANVIALVNPEVITLGGGCFRYPGYEEALLSTVERILRAKVPDLWLKTTIRRSAHPDEMVSVGALLLGLVEGRNLLEKQDQQRQNSILMKLVAKSLDDKEIML